MLNTALTADTNELVKLKKDLSLIKGDINGASIEVFNETNGTDYGSYIYTTTQLRDDDYRQITMLLNWN